MDTAGLGVIAYALSLNGSRYRYGGTSPSAGFDCSGFVQHVYGRHGVALPRDAHAMADSLPDVRRDAAQPGDLVFFKISRQAYSHVGIYLGGRRFIHATSRRTGDVRVSSLDLPYWRTRLAGIRRPAVAARLPAAEPRQLAWSRTKVAGFIVP
ncbi:MAG: C40 family peptidase [Gammaproteobacteria bacterium]